VPDTTEDPDASSPSAPLVGLVLVVAVGGMLGSVARYGLVAAFPDLLTTLIINVVGSFLLGVLVARRPDGGWARPFLGTGVLGGFTTFSAFAVQTLEVGWPIAIAYVAATLALGVGAAHVGLRCR